MKRSSQVALLLASVTAAGGAGYAMMSPNDCATPERPATVAPGATDQRAGCSSSSRSSSSSHSYGSNRSSYSGGLDDRSSSHSSSSSSTHASLGGGTSWGGFGSLGHAFSSSGS